MTDARAIIFQRPLTDTTAVRHVADRSKRMVWPTGTIVALSMTKRES